MHSRLSLLEIQFWVPKVMVVMHQVVPVRLGTKVAGF